MAEGILENLAQKHYLADWVIDSASTNTYHTNEPPHILSQKVCHKNGIDISGQRARRLQVDDIDAFDVVFVMANDVMQDVKSILGSHFDSSKVLYFLDVLYPGEHRNVPDPWYGDEEDYVLVFDMILQGCEKIIHRYK